MPEVEKPAKKPPKGGRKGGTLYPKLNLKQALEYSEKLVSKTHTGAQPATTILPGVFANAGPVGKVRASALKQFGLLSGDPKAYEATELAKQIMAATPEERPASLRLAFLNAKLFKEIFETYHGDTVTKAKIKQRALNLDVHPESADECVELFVDSAVTAGLAVEKHACKRLRQWLCAKHKEVWPGTKRFPEASLHDVLGLVCITKRTRNLPWASS